MKSKEKKSIFGNQVKRWFILDVINATFSYAKKKGKSASKTIAIWDIEECWQEGEDDGLKEWLYEFRVKTKQWEFSLFA